MFNRKEIFVSTYGYLHGDDEWSIQSELEIELSDLSIDDLRYYFPYYMKISLNSEVNQGNKARYCDEFISKDRVFKEINNKYYYSADEKSFVSLEEFIKKSKFIGKKFIRTGDIIGRRRFPTEEDSCMYLFTPVTVLYQYVDNNGFNWFLSYDEKSGEYGLITPMHTKDENYKIFGDTCNYLDDKETTLRNIEKQFNNVNKKIK